MIAEEIKGLSLMEKFQVMEMIWEDLRETIEEGGIPQAHNELLDERRARVARGRRKC